MQQIRWGLRKKIDVSSYATSEFDNAQMSEIRNGLENNI